MKPQAVTFQPGDVVQLHSGGPIMTVRQVWHHQPARLLSPGCVAHAECCWFENGNYHQQKFRFACLRKTVSPHHSDEMEVVEKWLGAPGDSVVAKIEVDPFQNKLIVTKVNTAACS